MNDDFEKDKFIKDKLKEDELISRKAEGLFKNIKNMEVEMEDNKVEKQESKKSNFSRIQKIISIAACAVIVFGGANIYASTQGYDNIFFMIKDKVSANKKETSDKDEILSDRDITISYKEIQISENLTVMVNELQIKDGTAKLFLKVRESVENDSTTVPLTYKIYNSSNKLLCSQLSSRASLETEEDSFPISYIEELVVNNYANDKILDLEIYKANGDKITTITIDLDEKTLEVQGEEENLKKISEIELKKFLGYEAGIEQYNFYDGDVNGTKILAVLEYLTGNDLLKDYDYLNKKDFYGVVEAQVANEVAEKVFGETIGTLSKNSMYSTYTEKGVKYYGMEGASDICINGTCIDISNISYCGGIYTVTFSYLYMPDTPEAIDINSLDIYQNAVSFKYDESNEYSKFLIVSKETPILIKSADKQEDGAIEGETIIVDVITNDTTVVDNNENSTTATEENVSSENISSNGSVENTTVVDNTTVIDENNNTSSENQTTTTSTTNVNNYASTMSWTQYWAPGIRFNYPTEFNLTELLNTYTPDNAGWISTQISGIATGIDPDTKEIINSNMTINIFEPEFIDADEANTYMYNENGLEKSSFTNSLGIRWYLIEYDSVGEHGEKYAHLEKNSDGTYTVYIIEFYSDNGINYKVRNIINWLLSTTEMTSF